MSLGATEPAASLVVSGGTTPARCFDELSELPLDWSRTHIVLSDERWVAPDNDDSNEKLVRDSLLKNKASSAKLLPVFHSTTTIVRRCDEIDRQIRDDFDSYATGQDLHGVNGWKGWFNDPAASASTTDAQARSNPNSVDIVGPSDLVREYSGYDSGQPASASQSHASCDITERCDRVADVW